jgi:hypothetical protein
LALTNQTSSVSVSMTLGISDLATSSQILNHVLPTLAFKAVQAQFQGYLNLPASSTVNLSPSGLVTSWAVVFVRNLPSSNAALVVNVTPTGGVLAEVVNLDIGGMFLYFSPLLGVITLGGVQPGIVTLSISTGPSTTVSAEVLLAG